MATQPISHALVLPDSDFMTWYKSAEAYTKAFERVAIIRSPSGNDLNRFRNVTAVQAPGVWQNNEAVTHIRRVYPMVVRVDLIRASTPTELGRILQERVRLNDRYGDTITPGNLYDRFTLDWPSDARPARLTRAFNDTSSGRRNEGVDVHAPQGTPIRAAVVGTVVTIIRQPTSLGYGQYIQVSCVLAGQTYLVTYAQLQNIRVSMGQKVQAGDVMAESAWDSIKLVVQQPGSGLTGYILPDVVDPTMMIYWQALRLRPSDTGLRIREKPGTDFRVLGQLRLYDRSEPLEPHGRTLLKVGQKNQWIKLRSPAGVEGYSAAEFLLADETSGIQALNMSGLNLDILHRLGKPDAARMKGAGWVRFPYNVSMDRGSTDLDAAYNLYAPYIERYAAAGLKVILVLTHQTFGEGQGYVWPNMNTGSWRELTTRYVDFARRIAARFAGRNLVTAYQIWNEQDTAPSVAHAAVPLPFADYAYMLTEAIKAIRSADSAVSIITGGHVGGPGNGATYARNTLAAMPSNVRPDGIACHSYGRGPVGNKFSPFGSIDEDVDAYGALLPGAPVWITEWGVLDVPNASATEVADYATGFISRLKGIYSGKVATCCWYGWADSMHNGYGLVNVSDQPKQPLYDRFLRA
jgi:hypothetical protein